MKNKRPENDKKNLKIILKDDSEFFHWYNSFFDHNSSLDEICSDKSFRMFGASFIFSDQLNFKDEPNLQLKNNIEKSSDFCGEKYDIKIIKNPKNNLFTQINVQAKGNEFLEFIHSSYSIMSRITDFICYVNKISINIRKIYFHDNKYNYTYFFEVDMPSALSHVLDDLPLIPLNFSEHHHAIFNIYKDAISSNNFAYKYICLFKIIEAFEGNKNVFKLTNNAYKNKYGSYPKRNTIFFEDTYENSSFYYLMDLLQAKNAKLGKYYGSLKKIRNYLCHAQSYRNQKGVETYLKVDEYEFQRRLEIFCNFLKIIVDKILEEELILIDQISKN